MPQNMWAQTPQRVADVPFRDAYVKPSGHGCPGAAETAAVRRRRHARLGGNWRADYGERHSPGRVSAIFVAPCTTNIRGLPSEVVLEPGDDPVPKRSALNLDSVESVSVAVLVERLGALSDDRMRDVCAALAVAVDCGG